MSADSKIEWTDHTFNPWWGCTKVSPGCKNCYADREATRFGFTSFGSNPRRMFGASRWREPLKWDKAAAAAGKKARVFTASMADVFEDHPTADEERPRLWELIRQTPNLIWLVLTKRADRIAECLPADWGNGYVNVALGVSAENQEYADARVPALLSVPARWRFVSAEPLFGPVDLTELESVIDGERRPLLRLNALRGGHRCGPAVYGDTDARLHWVIVGGESGPGARPMHPNWARDIRDDCMKAGVPFFFKQWGEWAAVEYYSTTREFSVVSLDGRIHGIPWGGWANEHRGACVMHRVGKHNAGRLLDGREWNQTPWGEEGVVA